MNIKKRHIQTQTTFLENGLINLKIINQTEVGNNFSKYGNEYKSKNGIILKSSEATYPLSTFFPSYYSSTLFVIGEKRNNCEIIFKDEKDYLNIINAINEYNESEGGFKYLDIGNKKRKILFSTAETENCGDIIYKIVITEQTEIQEKFSKYGNTYKAKNGVTLISELFPSFILTDLNNIILYTRGYEKESNYLEICIENCNNFEKVLEAIDEYNETEGGFKEMKKNKIEFIYKWDDFFSCGFIRIIKQEEKIKEFKTKNGITIISDLHPDWDSDGLVLFIRGSFEKKDNDLIQFNSLEEYKMAIDSLNEYNNFEINNLKFHKELWENVAITHDKSGSCEKICKKYGIKMPINNCFLCEEAGHYNGSINCHLCKGKWFNNYDGKKTNCNDSRSYFNMWYYEKDLDLKRALAIKISKCAD